MNLAMPDDHSTVTQDVGIGQVGGKQDVVFADRRTEEQRAARTNQELEPRQESRALVIEALVAALRRHDVAILIEHTETVAVLHHAQWHRRPLGVGHDVVLLADAQRLWLWHRMIHATRLVARLIVDNCWYNPT